MLKVFCDKCEQPCEPAPQRHESLSALPAGGTLGVELVPLFDGVDTLPAASAALQSVRGYVTNASGLALGSAVVAGGTLHCSVFCDSTNWIVG